MPRFRCLALLATLCVTFPLSGGNRSVLFGELESQLAADAGDNDRLDRFTILDAALVATGINDREQVESLVQRLANSDTGLSSKGGEPQVRAEQLFRWMHEKLLTGKYVAECSSLNKTLTTGNFNCVTATLIYYWLAERHGLASRIVSTRSHVFSELAAERQKPLRIETTCPTWFRQASKPRPADDARRYLSEIQLIGKIYYNRGVAALQKKRFSDAIALLKRSLEFDPLDEAARENVLAALNNWALDECTAGNFQRAAELVLAGMELNPRYAPFLANDLHIHQKWVLDLCRQQQHEAALNLLQQRFRSRADARLFDEGRLAVCRSWVLDAIKAGDAQAAQAAIDRFSHEFGHHKSFTRYHLSTLQAAISNWRQRGESRMARVWATRALKTYPDDNKLRELRGQLTHTDS